MPTVQRTNASVSDAAPYSPPPLDFEPLLRYMAQPNVAPQTATGPITAEPCLSTYGNSNPATTLLQSVGSATPTLASEILNSGTANERKLWYWNMPAGSQLAIPSVTGIVPKTLWVIFRIPSLSADTTIWNSALGANNNYGFAFTVRATSGQLSVYGNNNAYLVQSSLVVTANTWTVFGMTNVTGGVGYAWLNGNPVTLTGAAASAPVDSGGRSQATATHHLAHVATSATSLNQSQIAARGALIRNKMLGV